MKLSQSVILVWRIAAREMIRADFAEILPEHFGMALLKFAELSFASDGDADQTKVCRDLADDSRLMREMLRHLQVNSKHARHKLRAELGLGKVPFTGGEIHRSVGSRCLFELAAASAADAGVATLTPVRLLTALVQAPSPVMARILLSQILTVESGRKRRSEYRRKPQSRRRPDRPHGGR